MPIGSLSVRTPPGPVRTSAVRYGVSLETSAHSRPCRTPSLVDVEKRAKPIDLESNNDFSIDNGRRQCLRSKSD